MTRLKCSCCGDVRIWAEIPASGPRYMVGRRCLVASCPRCKGACKGVYASA